MNTLKVQFIEPLHKRENKSRVIGGKILNVKYSKTAIASRTWRYPLMQNL